MAINEVDRSVVSQEVTPAGGQETIHTQVRHTETASKPAGPELTRRIVVLLFGLIQIVIGARIVLLLLDAREANGLVSGILDLSQLFVGPFEGILRTDSLSSAGSIFDITAVVALVGWTVLEFIVLKVVGIYRREPV